MLFGNEAEAEEEQEQEQEGVLVAVLVGGRRMKGEGTKE
jgi:hypothetical protein